MWHSQFISRGASYSWWGLTLGDFKGAQTWKFLPHQEEKIKRKYFHSFYIVDGHPGLSHGWREGFHTREKRLWENCWKGCSGIWLELEFTVTRVWPHREPGDGSARVEGPGWSSLLELAGMKGPWVFPGAIQVRDIQEQCRTPPERMGHGP